MRWFTTVQSGFLMAMLCGVPIYFDDSHKPKNSIHGAKNRETLRVRPCMIMHKGCYFVLVENCMVWMNVKQPTSRNDQAD